MTHTIITCISDVEHFNKSVFDYLISELERQMRFKENKKIGLKTNSLKFNPDDNEIQIDETANVPKRMVKRILQSFLEAEPVRYKGYGVIEFGDAFTIGRILDPSKMEMYSCEICGFFTPHSEELPTHRMTHFGI